MNENVMLEEPNFERFGLCVYQRKEIEWHFVISYLTMQTDTPNRTRSLLTNGTKEDRFPSVMIVNRMARYFL